ncbi:MAG TPA: formate dehydrogenase accessory sulfurtransferase FdhD [Spirochaetota bacterium]|nr:formate dehydrogenase accessory sulfurtransferase FdhD [Spirochaetota bacterium]HPC39887.1 formate dehydrogenase accessory sulfurtransferase FdhD [Spirochaetota bacterium]HPL18047.1 formate dehydrogenase accessory sulfurtransferase FdhD [Spirochaetota bacterium]HQF08937.1 formate dehydrogenase accessory sulfurtransferase FdhD [Spirochaetota bacterium]HQH97863.1 formate dehydrogenase accessory sulfurtransferase FdhD [Spirochaetota bacterium]
MAFTDGAYRTRTDTLAVESSLSIVINGKTAYYCMRTPGMDRELALGLCFSNGRIRSADDLKNLDQPDGSTVAMDIPGSPAGTSDEIGIIRSSAGIVSKDRDSIPSFSETGDLHDIRFNSRMLFNLQEDFSSRQNIFRETGATHAAAFYDEGGLPLAFAEDVGRHNALDKCIGKLLLERGLSRAVFCILSSRLSYEMVMKAARAGIRVTAGASAPTAFAVDFARSKGLTLVGFLRTGRFNVYSGQWRVDTSV